MGRSQVRVWVIPMTIKKVLIYCSSTFAGHNELEKGECLDYKKAQLIRYTMDLQTNVV